MGNGRRLALLKKASYKKKLHQHRYKTNGLHLVVSYYYIVLLLHCAWTEFVVLPALLFTNYLCPLTCNDFLIVKN